MNWFILFLQFLLFGAGIYITVREASERKKRDTSALPSEFREQASSIIRNINKTTFDNISLIEEKIKELNNLVDVADKRLAELKRAERISAQMLMDDNSPRAFAGEEPKPYAQNSAPDAARQPAGIETTAAERPPQFAAPVEMSQPEGEARAEELGSAQQTKRPLPENRKKRMSMIPKLAKQGLSQVEIAAELELSVAEVNQYMQLFSHK